MKRFLLFCFDKHYPLGGWDDLTAQSDYLTDLINHPALYNSDLHQVVDTTTGKIVLSGELLK